MSDDANRLQIDIVADAKSAAEAIDHLSTSLEKLDGASGQTDKLG